MNKDIDQKNIILEQAFQSFTREGPRNFTIDGFASDMSMSKKTIYKFFPTKEILIEKIFEFFTGSIRRKFEELARSDENPIVKFNQATEFLQKRIINVPSKTLLELKMRYPNVWQQIADFRKEMTQYIAKFFKEAQEQGLAKADIDMDKAAKIFLFMANSLQPEFFMTNNLAPADAIKLFMRMITEGLLTEEGIALRTNN